MKKMIYKAEEHVKEILHSGSYKGYNFYIVSYGIHPCAYVEIPKNHRWFGKDYDEEELETIQCHYGLTYADNLNHVLGKEQSKDRWFIGWDYGHTGDYEGYNEMLGFGLNDKKWTTKEIYEEVKNVIEQIISLNSDADLRKEEKEDMVNDDYLIIEALKNHIRVNVDTVTVEIYDDYGTKVVLKDLAEPTFEAFKANYQNF